MIICFECASSTKELLDSIVESEQYKDYGEAISSAIENLSVLQEELSRKGVLVFESEDESAVTRSEPKDKKKASSPNHTARHSESARVKKEDSKPKALPLGTAARIPEVFLLDGIGEPLPALASPPGDVWVKGQEVPLERWIFGQHNRLLPVKASCRALAHFLNDKPNGVPLDEAASRISEEALTLGNFLAHLDKQNGTKLDNALSTAFPSHDRDVEKSKLRYGNQFVAGVSKQGRVSGLLIDLKLINHMGGKNPNLKLTEAGWHFAALRNPILDGGMPETTQKFTAEEKSFLLDHIYRSVPAEDFVYRSILAAVGEGAKTPEELDSALRRHISQNVDRNLTKSFLSSQRSGAVSRMADLGLITRKRSGVKVSYVIDDLGRQYVQDKVIPLQRRKHLE